MAPIICVSSPLVPGPFLPAVGKQRGLSQRPAANRRLAGSQFQAPFSFPLQKTSGCSNIRGSTSPWIRVHTSLHVVLHGRHRAPQSVHVHLKRRLVPFPEIGNWFRGPLLYIHVSSFFRILNMAVAKSPQGLRTGWFGANARTSPQIVHECNCTCPHAHSQALMSRSNLS